MNRRVIAVIACVWVLSLLGVAVWAQSTPPQFPRGNVITGEDIGFQPVGAPPTRDGKVIGKWVIKVNGKWVETQTTVEITRGGSN